MADSAFVESQLAGLTDSGERQLFTRIFEYILRDIRFGRAVTEEATKNFGGGFFSSRTPGVANTEFSVAHNFGRKPYLLIPLLPLDTMGAKTVRLEVTKPADEIRIYLRSPDTNAAVFFYVEG